MEDSDFMAWRMADKARRRVRRERSCRAGFAAADNGAAFRKAAA